MSTKSFIAAMGALVTVSVILAAYQPQAEPTVSPYAFYQETQCTESLVVECAADIELTVRNCAAAFETGGANIIADIKCAKDLLSDKKHCWPCICAEAKKKGWKIIGC
jgi:hypothetical protein